MHCELGIDGYTPQHLALIARLGPIFAEGLRTELSLGNARRGDWPGREDGPGLVVLADDLSITATTPAGERWLGEIGDRASSPSRSFGHRPSLGARALRGARAVVATHAGTRASGR